MKAFLTITILLVALITTYAASAWSLPLQMLGTQLAPLPPLMLATALRTPITTIAILAIFASLTQSALSSDPLGLSLLPLYTLGFIVHINSHNLLHHHIGSRFALGAIAGAMIPLMSLALLLLTNKEPLIGWFSLWQWAASILSSGLMTLIFYPLIEWLDKSVEEQPLAAPFDTTTTIIRHRRFHE